MHIAHFDAWKYQPWAKSVLNILCLNRVAKHAHSWAEMREATKTLNNCHDLGSVVGNARGTFRKLSSGERILVAAVLTGLNFTWLADELYPGAMKELRYADRDVRAIALAALAADDDEDDEDDEENDE